MNVALQIIAFLCVLGGVWLISHKKRAAWIVYQFGGIAWILLYFRKGLYIAICAQCVYMCMNVYGWLKWGEKQ